MPDGGPRILIVEDEALIAAMLEEMLQGLGVQVVGPAHDLGRACELARTEACDAAVLDVSIRGQTVAAVADILSERGVPFILATGYGGGMEAAWPDVPVVEKPYSLEDLSRALGLVGVDLGIDRQGSGARDVNS